MVDKVCEKRDFRPNALKAHRPPAAGTDAGASLGRVIK
jgi:hypothetical protein